MTDSSDPKAPKSSRKKPRREPATIDLKAVVVDDGASREAAPEQAEAQEGAQERVPEEARPEETIAAGAEPPEQGADTLEAGPDSGMGADSIRPFSEKASSEEKSPEATPPGEAPPQEAASETAPPPRAEAGRRMSPAALVGMGILGGLVGAGLVYGAQTWLEPGAQDDQRLAQLEQRVSTLRQPAPGQQGDLQAVQARIEALEGAQESLARRVQAAQDAAEQAAMQAQEAATRAGEALNRPLPETAAPQEAPDLTPLTERLTALENQVRSQAQGETQAAAEAANAVQALEGRLNEQEQRLSELSGTLSDLSRTVTEETRQARAAETASQAGIRVVLAGRLNDALRNGAPYADLLDALRRAGADAQRLAALEPFAEQGAPTAEALAQDFAPLEATILRDERAASGEWSDRVMRMLDRVVTVRPVDEPGSAGVPGTLARIRQALERGEVSTAAEAWASLPEPSRRISEDWGRRVTAAAEARRASGEIAAEALTAFNRVTQ